MPYITDKARCRLHMPGNYASTSGELTYAFQQYILQYIGNDYSYADLAEVLGALEATKADFIEMVLKPYEAKKRKENGNVW